MHLAKFQVTIIRTQEVIQMHYYRSGQFASNVSGFLLKTAEEEILASGYSVNKIAYFCCLINDIYAGCKYSGISKIDSFFDNEDEVRSECSSHQDDDYDEGKTL